MKRVSWVVSSAWVIIFLLFGVFSFGLYRLGQESETLRTQMNTVAARTDSLENRAAGVEQGNSPVTDRMSALEGRIASVETEQSNASFAERMEALNQRITEVEQGLQMENAAVLGEDVCVPSEVVTENQVDLCLRSFTAEDAEFSWRTMTAVDGIPYGAAHSDVYLLRADWSGAPIGTAIASSRFEYEENNTAVNIVGISGLTPQPSDSGTLRFTPDPGARYMLEVQVRYVTRIGNFTRTGQYVFTMPAN